jgi:hypothetical protein
VLVDVLHLAAEQLRVLERDGLRLRDRVVQHHDEPDLRTAALGGRGGREGEREQNQREWSQNSPVPEPPTPVSPRCP